MTNTELAFRHSLNTLTQHLAGQSRIFFWTITSPEVLEKPEFARRWNNFVRRVKRRFPGMPWIRVFELHPGDDGDFNGHGLHAHAVFPQFRRWEVLDDIARKVGLGRVHVKPLPIGQARNYLSKYLSKTKRAEAPAILYRARLWQCVNFPDKTKVSDIQRWTFQAWFHRRAGSNGDIRHLIKLIRSFNRKLSLELESVRLFAFGYVKFLKLSRFFIDNVLELAQGLQNFYNWDFLEACGQDSQPLKVF